MEEFLSWFEPEILKFCFIAFAIMIWCLFVSMYLRRKKGEDSTLAFVFSMIACIVGFVAIPVIIVIGIPGYYIIKYLGEAEYREGSKNGRELGYTLGRADERRSHGWDD